MRTSLRLVLALAMVVAVAGCSKSSSDANADKKATTTTPSTTAVTTSTTQPDTLDTVVLTPGTGSTTAYGKAIATGLTNSDPTTGLFVMNSHDAACVGPKWAAAMGSTLLQKGGKPADYESHTFSYPSIGLSKKVATGMIDAFAACQVDLYHGYLDILISEAKGTTGKALSPTKQACIGQQLTASDVRTLLIAALQDPSGVVAGQTIAKVGKACQLSS